MEKCSAASLMVSIQRNTWRCFYLTVVLCSVVNWGCCWTCRSFWSFGTHRLCLQTRKICCIWYQLLEWVNRFFLGRWEHHKRFTTKLGSYCSAVVGLLLEKQRLWPRWCPLKQLLQNWMDREIWFHHCVLFSSYDPFSSDGWSVWYSAGAVAGVLVFPALACRGFC